MRSTQHARALRSGLRPLAACALVVSAAAQNDDVLFSIEFHGPTIATQNSVGQLYTAGDVLARNPLGGLLGPNDPPRIVLDGGQLGLPQYLSCVGVPGGQPCPVEVDALSLGRDYLLEGTPNETFFFYFSVEERAVGHPLLAQDPSVVTEAPVGDSSSDVWVTLPFPAPLPVAPPQLGQPPQQGEHRGLIDGDGLLSGSPLPTLYPALGVVEPNRVGFGLPTFAQDEGDNLDALDRGLQLPITAATVYFSVDGQLVSGGAPGTNTAATLGVLPGDVLQLPPGGQPMIYATSSDLGLTAGDDLDALILRENGSPGFQPSQMPYDWVPGADDGTPTDMLLFSVRDGSSVVGAPDSLFAVPIEPGDLLMPPVGGGATPAIFVPAEELGLQTERNGAMEADELDAADLEDDPWEDWNNNGIDDAVDIAKGTSADDNDNNIPDECERPGDAFCDCITAPTNCGNATMSGGCANSTGQGAELVGLGSSSAYTADLGLQITGMPANQFGLLFMGPAASAGAPLGDGRICVAPGTGSLYRFPVFNGMAAGSHTESDIVPYSCNTFPQAGCLVTGSTWHFQAWYRDPGGPCSSGNNLTNGWRVTLLE